MLSLIERLMVGRGYRWLVLQEMRSAPFVGVSWRNVSICSSGSDLELRLDPAIIYIKIKKSISRRRRSVRGVIF